MTQPKPLLCSLCCNNPAVYNLALSYQLNACDKLPKILNALVIKCAPGMVGELISDTYKR